MRVEGSESGAPSSIASAAQWLEARQRRSSSRATPLCMLEGQRDEQTMDAARTVPTSSLCATATPPCASTPRSLRNPSHIFTAHWRSEWSRSRYSGCDAAVFIMRGAHADALRLEAAVVSSVGGAVRAFRQ